MELQRTRTVVTGAAGGLGRHFTLRFLENGGSVAAGDVDTAGLRSLRREAGDAADRLHVAPLDVTDESSVVAFVAAASESLGALNGAVHCAGVLRDGLLVEPDEDGAPRKLPLALWRRVLDINLTGGFLITREVAASLLAGGAGEGFIIHMSSLSRGGNPGQANYAASKAGLDAAMRTWALELAPHGIRVASIAPGVVDTPFLQGIGDEALERLTASIPLGRIGRPEEMWRAVRFLVECDFYTGRVLEVDGGAAMPGSVPGSHPSAAEGS